MSRFLSRFLRDERGTTAIEYAMIAVGIGVAIVVTVTLIGTTLNEGYTEVAAGFS